MDEMQAELQRLASKSADIEGLRTAVTDLKAEVTALRAQNMIIGELEAQVRALREVIASLLAPRPTDSNRARMPSKYVSNSAVFPVHSSY